MQQLECLAASVQDEVAALCGYWEELHAALAAQRASRPACVRVVRRSQCLYFVSCKLLAQACQTQVCDPSTRPNCAGMLRGTVICERRDWFSELADVTVAVARAPGSAAVLRPVTAKSREDFNNNAG